MKNSLLRNFALVLIFEFGQQIGFSQGSFEDLNFENATIVPDPSSPYYPYAVNAADALPGWTIVAGGLGGGDIAYNDEPLGAAWATLQGPGSLNPILQGNYSVILYGSSAGGPANAAIGQTGQIPASSQSLLFYGYNLVNLQVSFAGQPLSYSAVGSGPNYTIYGANIAGYAGQTGQLEFDAPSNGGGEIDNILFSTQPIPEPQTWTLLFCGASALSLWRWKRKALFHQRATSIK